MADYEKSLREQERKKRQKDEFEALKKAIKEDTGMSEKYYHSLEYINMLEKSFEDFQKYKKLKKEVSKILKEKY